MAAKPLFPELVFGERTELGESTAVADGFDVGALRAEEAGRRAVVIRLRAGSASVVDVGASWGDAPPPQLMEHGGATYAIAYVRPPSGRGSRALGLYRVGTLAPALLFPAESDDSRAYDVATPREGKDLGALIAWDDLGRGSSPAPYGVVQLGALSSDMSRLESVRTIEAPESDSSVHASASDPRLVPRSKGYWLTWTARRPERPTTPLPLPAGEVETPTEEPTFSWVDAVALDSLGAPAGAPRRLTPQGGHVGSYAATAHGDGLLIVTEDDGGFNGRGGGSLQQIVWMGDGAPDTTSIVRSGVEEDTPPRLLVDGANVWAEFVGVGTPSGAFGSTDSSEGTAMLLRLGDGRTQFAPVAEPLLFRGEPLGFARGALAVATPNGQDSSGGWHLRWLTCTR